MIDWTKPVEVRWFGPRYSGSWHELEVVRTNVKGEFPVLCLYDDGGNWKPITFTLDFTKNDFQHVKESPDEVLALLEGEPRPALDLASVRDVVDLLRQAATANLGAFPGAYRLRWQSDIGACGLTQEHLRRLVAVLDKGE